MNYFNKNKNFRAMALAAVLTAGSGLTGCTDQEVAQSIGAIAIVGGAIAIGATTDCQGGYKDVCHDFRDYWGDLHTECHKEYDSCLYLVPKKDRDDGRSRLEFAAIEKADADVSAFAADAAAADQASTELTYEAAEAVATPVRWGKTFGISFEASKTFIDAMKAAKAGDPKAIEDLGLKKKDLEKIASQTMPSEQAVESVAMNLKQDKEAVRVMIWKLLIEAQKPEVQAAAAAK